MPSSCSTSVWPVMTTSVPLSESEKIWSKDWLIVSVSTNVPATSATPRKIARKVVKARSLRARDPAQRDLGHG